MRQQSPSHLVGQERVGSELPVEGMGVTDHPDLLDASTPASVHGCGFVAELSLRLGNAEQSPVVRAGQGESREDVVASSNEFVRLDVQVRDRSCAAIA